MRIAIIGMGNLGSSIAKGLINHKMYSSLYLTKKSSNSNILECFQVEQKEGGVVITTDNILAIKKSDIIIFCVQPTQLENILKELNLFFQPNHIIISTVTGVSISDITAIVGSNKSIIRVMPNTAIAVGQSMTCICANEQGLQKLSIAKDIFDKLGYCLSIPENLMQAATVICASGIAFWMRLIRATSQGAIQLGFDSQKALELALHTCLGAAQLLKKSALHPEQEIDKVTTPRGCTIEGLNEMEHQGLSSSLIKGIVASFEKINSIKN